MFFICGTSPVIEGKQDTVVEIYHHQVGPTEEAAQLLAGGVRGDTSAGIKIIQVKSLSGPDKSGIFLCLFRARMCSIPVVEPERSDPTPLQSRRTIAKDTY